MSSDINTPRLALLVVHNGPKRDGASSYTRSNGDQLAKNSKGAYLSLLCKNTKGNDSTVQIKTKHTKIYR